jgi:hypothetical protein
VSAPELPPNKHQERSMRTRALLPDAAIESLSEVGYAQASTAESPQRRKEIRNRWTELAAVALAEP